MIFAPVLVSLLFSLLTLMAGTRMHLVRFLSLMGSVLCFGFGVYIAAMVLTGGTQSLQFGGWPKSFGISFTVDTLSALLLLVSSLVALCGTIASLATVSLRWEKKGYYPLYHFLMMGIFGAFSTGDLFNLYVWFEVLLMASFFLISITKKRSALSGGFKYAVLNVLSSMLFLVGIAFVYAASGTLDFARLIQVSLAQGQSAAMVVGVVFLVVAFSIKAGLFPFFFWLPASYPSAITALAAVFSGLLTKVGVYALLRVLIPLSAGGSHGILIYLYFAALVSMVLGVLGALSQDNIKGILSFHIVSQVGYIVLSFSLGTSFGVAASVFYLLHHIVVKTNLFFSAAYVEKIGGTLQVSKLGGFWQKNSFLGVMFAISALSLIGIPPLSGFWAKVFTLQSAMGVHKWGALILCLAVSLFTLMSMLKIWLGVFWRPYKIREETEPSLRLKWLMVPLVVLNLWTLAVGLGAPQIFKIAETVSRELTVKGDIP
ncbi:Na(+)/H(+) antiporter subunit D [compost metagenome]